MLEVERWRLRQAQEADGEIAPFLTFFEYGERELRKKWSRKEAGIVKADLVSYELRDGLIHRIVRKANREYNVVVWIPTGGARGWIGTAPGGC